MKKRFALTFALLAVLAALTAPAAGAKPPPVCTYVPDLDGHLYGPVCVPFP